MIKGPKKSVNVVMPLELYEEVREQAEITSRTIPGYIRQVLRQNSRPAAAKKAPFERGCQPKAD